MITLTEKRLRELENKYTLLLAGLEDKKIRSETFNKVVADLSQMKHSFDSNESRFNAIKDELSRQEIVSNRNYTELDKKSSHVESSLKSLEPTLVNLPLESKANEKHISDLKSKIDILGAGFESYKASNSGHSEKLSSLVSELSSLRNELAKAQNMINGFTNSLTAVQDTEKNRWVDEKHVDEELREANKSLREKLEEVKNNANAHASELNSKLSKFTDLESKMAALSNSCENRNEDSALNTSLKAFYDKVDKQGEKLKSMESALAEVLGMMKTLKKS